MLNHILQNIRLCRNSQLYLNNLYNFFVYFAVKILTFLDKHTSLLKLKFAFSSMIEVLRLLPEVELKMNLFL